MGYRGIVSMGNGAQGVWGTRDMGNGSHGQWGTGVCSIWAMRPTGGIGHMGNRGTGGMGYKGMAQVGNGIHG